MTSGDGSRPLARVADRLLGRGSGPALRECGQASADPLGSHTQLTSIIARALRECRADLGGRSVARTDALLQCYYDTDVDWYALWSSAHRRALSVPDYGSRPYWIPIGRDGGWVPITCLAFLGPEGRAKVARDRATDLGLLEIMADDDDALVQSHARRRTPERREC